MRRFGAFFAVPETRLRNEVGGNEAYETNWPDGCEDKEKMAGFTERTAERGEWRASGWTGRRFDNPPQPGTLPHKRSRAWCMGRRFREDKGIFAPQGVVGPVVGKTKKRFKHFLSPQLYAWGYKFLARRRSSAISSISLRHSATDISSEALRLAVCLTMSCFSALTVSF